MVAAPGLRLRPGGVRLPGHGAGDHRGRLLRSRHRQRPVGVRAVRHRDRSRTSSSRSRRTYGFDVDFEAAKHLLEENDGAGNTFKATAKPVLIGTAVVGATTMIFSIIVLLTAGLTQNLDKLSLLHPPFLLGLITRRRRDLLVHRRLDAGGDDGSVPRGGVHQGQHQARGVDQGLGRGQQEGRGHLHPVRAEGDVQHLPDRLLLDARLRLPRALLLRRLPDLHRALRPLPGHLHGQCRRRLGQRQEDRRGGAEGEGHRRSTPPPSSATPSAIPSRTPRRWP